MNDAPILVLALLAGVLLGATFFGGLWWTTQKCVSSKRPVALFVGSLLLRTTMTVAGFYFISHGDWRNTLACLVGFLISRVVVTRITRASIDERTRASVGSAT
jgi:F1F0 ATPase subunit 2